LIPWRGRVFAAIEGPSLDPTSIKKYVMPLVIPPAMPKTGRIGRADYYEIAVRQFQQQILPLDMPPTTVWSYGSVNHPGTFNYPAFTIEANYHIPVRVTWRNQLVDSSGNFLPHLLPVDPTLHWANPPGGAAGRDMRPAFTSTPGPYTGPVPIVTHLHGGTARKKATAMPRPGSCPRQTTSRAASPQWVPFTFLFGTNSRKNPARFGRPARRPSSMRTNNGQGPSGITTTPSA
jgi:hypothetical protein